LGEHRTYDVTLNVARKDSGVCIYAGWVLFEHDLKGTGLMVPFVADTCDEAVKEARVVSRRTLKILWVS
jgi:hypothetical protein